MQVHSKKLFFLIVIFILIITITLISAQDDFELWKKQQSEEFRTYKDTLDKAFVEFLEQQWKDFAIFKGDIRDETPKPEKVPQIEEVGQKEFPDTHKVQEIQIPEKIFQVDEFEIKNRDDTNHYRTDIQERLKNKHKRLRDEQPRRD